MQQDIQILKQKVYQ